MHRYKLIIEYDGTPFLGWQTQKNKGTIQENIEDAIFSITQENTTVCGAGRTDSGVHARGQVAHADIIKDFDPFTLQEAINFHLKHKGISILSCEKVPHTFHARFSAKKRIYHYKILNRRSPPALERNRVWHILKPLDIAAMQEGAKYLLGYNDFSSFRAAACQSSSPYKTLDKLDIEKENSTIIFIVEARSFLHHQVCNMVGTLKQVGEGKITPQQVDFILKSKDRTKAGPTAPPDGLYLMEIFY